LHFLLLWNVLRRVRERYAAKETNMILGNVFRSIPEDLTEEVFDILAQSKDVKIERIVSKGQSSPSSRWYEQEQNEWVIVLKGEAVISFEHGKEIDLKVGNYINIPAYTKHRVNWSDPNTETIWLAVHY